tara:strand:- start:1678 stop:1968 length:291 start_codon:yes stop_codon:yes gene_type:complete
MRKITQESIAAFNSNETFSKSNTAVSVTDTTTVLLLHGNSIAFKDRTTGKVKITHCGWDTTTTKERLNAIDGVSIQQRQFQWYLNDELWHGELIQI